jgi:hypothetical protein
MNSSDKEDTVGKEMTKNADKSYLFEAVVLTDEEKADAILEGQKKKFFKERSKDNPKLEVDKK